MDDIFLVQTSTPERLFVKVYRDFLNCGILSGTEQIIFIHLKQYVNFANDNGSIIGTVYPKLSTLAKNVKMTEKTVREILKSLKRKGIIEIKQQGLNKPNIYKINDIASMWKSENEQEIKSEISQLEESMMIETLRAKGYYVSKNKESEESAPSKVTDNSDSTKLTQEKYIVETEKSQDIEKKYSMEWLKNHYEYEQMLEECPEEQETIDNIMQILHEDMNTSAKTLRVGKENKPKETYISKMIKLTSKGILYAIRKYKEVREPIGNVTNYIRTLLYRAEEQRHLDNLNKQAVQNNQYNNDQGVSLPSRSIELERCWGMTKSQERYLNYSQRDYTQEEWDDMEQKLLALSVPT